MSDDALAEARAAIDRIDQHVQQLLVQRAQYAKTIGDLKRADVNAEHFAFYRPERELQVLQTIMARDCGLLAPEAMARIFRWIMAGCLTVQQPLMVAFLGPKGTFSQIAAMQYFDKSAGFEASHTIADVFEFVESHPGSYGIVPVENSIGGWVLPTLVALVKTGLVICDEISIVIEQHLLRRTDDTDPIQRIYSHEQALRQCQQWLQTHYPDAEQIALDSTAAAAQHVQKESGCAAIASELAEKQYELTKVVENIADVAHNQTRFLVLGQQTAAAQKKFSFELNQDEIAAVFKGIWPASCISSK